MERNCGLYRRHPADAWCFSRPCEDTASAEWLELTVDAIPRKIVVGGHRVMNMNREAQRRKERQELETKLLAGLQSPTSEMTADDWKALRDRILARSPELRDEG
jgi:hypothetical protein